MEQMMTTLSARSRITSRLELLPPDDRLLDEDGPFRGGVQRQRIPSSNSSRL